jgi:uncharacterized protein YutE (UPF0331/DUF86 family)
MNVSAIGAPIDALLAVAQQQASILLQNTLYQGTLGVMHALYGPDSSQERDLRTYVERLSKNTHPSYPQIVGQSIAAITGTLVSIKGELESGFLGSLRAGIAGELLTDLLKLARAVLDQGGDEAKNVSAVLAAAAFEDMVRRLADLNGLPQDEKLADVLSALKSAGVLRGAEVGIAQSYLGFRNKALHARWTEVDLPAVQAVLAFTEQVILQRFR